MWRKGTIAAFAIALLLTGCSTSAEPVSSTVTSGSSSTTEPSQSTTQATTTTTLSVDTTTTTAATPSTTTAPPDPANPRPGWDTWTLIYASLDTDDHSLGDADVIASGVPNARVLLSDEYPSLHPGYWVVYAGEWHDRHPASVWCPRPLDPELSCYPRYLGPNVVDLLADGAAIVQLAEKLVVIDPESGETLANFSDNFHNEAVFPARFNLNGREGELYFSLGFEDSWYSCDSDKGQIRRLDLDSGTEDVFADGWSPAISPDGRWLAIVSAQECYPDPGFEGWVITPGSQVEIYDLSTDGFSPSYVLRPETPPTSYEDQQQVLAVFWDPAVPGDLLVALADNSMRRIEYDSPEFLTSARVDFSTGDPYLAAVTADAQYFLNYYDELFVLTVVDRASGEIATTWELDGWWTTVAVSSDDEVLIGTTDRLILPSGKEVAIDGDVHNLAW